MRENDILDRVKFLLDDSGWEILQMRYTSPDRAKSFGNVERDVDLVAQKDGRRVYVEAKGSVTGDGDP